MKDKRRVRKVAAWRITCRICGQAWISRCQTTMFCGRAACRKKYNRHGAIALNAAVNPRFLGFAPSGSALRKILGNPPPGGPDRVQ